MVHAGRITLRIGFLLLITVISLFAVYQGNFRVLGNDGTIVYIRADGSVDPQTASIASLDNITYVLSGTISDPIVVERDNILLEGNGYAVEGSGIGRGLDLSGRANVTIQNSWICGFERGIWVFASKNVSVFNNTVSQNTWNGINLTNSTLNTILGNQISGNGQCGIYLGYLSHNNTVIENNIANNQYGVYLWLSSENVFFHNNFFNNTKHVDETYSPRNTWDDGYPSGGNHWDDYLLLHPNASEVDGSGIWNEQYVVVSSNIDNYPLMNAYMIPEYPPTAMLIIMAVATVTVLILRKRL